MDDLCSISSSLLSGLGPNFYLAPSAIILRFNTSISNKKIRYSPLTVRTFSLFPISLAVLSTAPFACSTFDPLESVEGESEEGDERSAPPVPEEGGDAEENEITEEGNDEANESQSSGERDDDVGSTETGFDSQNDSGLDAGAEQGDDELDPEPEMPTEEPPPPDEIDLELESAFSRQRAVFEDGVVTTWARVINNGNIRSGSYDIWWMLSRSRDARDVFEFLCETQASSLAPGEEELLSATCELDSPSAGNHHIVGIVDPDEKIPESDETNNIYVSENSIEIVERTVDLEPTDLEINATQFTHGDVINFNGVVRNTGSTSTTNFEIYYKFIPVNAVDDQFYFCRITYDLILDAGESDEVPMECNVTDTVVAGEYNISIEVDPNLLIEESDEDNNEFFHPSKIVVSEPRLLDLEALAVSTADHEVHPGEEVEFSFSAANRGNTSISRFNYSLYYSRDTSISTSDTRICSGTITDALGAGLRRTFTVDCDVPNLNGSYYLGLVLDPSNLITETLENNNRTYDPSRVSISPEAPKLPDLVLPEVSTETKSINTPESLDLTAKVRNIGTEDAENFSVRFYFSTDAIISSADALICQSNFLGTLSPAQTQTITNSCPTPFLTAGSYYLGAIVDGDNEIVESDETNNRGLQAEKISINE